MSVHIKSISACLFIILTTTSVIGQIDFGAYYTQLSTGQAWESYSRTGKYADMVVRLSQAGAELVFWRATANLPYWKTEKGQWDLSERL
jgi:hypothetical protein